MQGIYAYISDTNYIPRNTVCSYFVVTIHGAYIVSFSVQSLLLLLLLLTKEEWQCMCKGNTEAQSCNHCYIIKARSITHSECTFVASVIQHVKHMRVIMFSAVSCLTLYLIHCTIFGSNLLNIRLRCDCLYNFEKLLTLRINQRDIIINVGV